MKVFRQVVVWTLRATATVVAMVLASVGVLAQPLAVPAWIMFGAMVGGGIALYDDQRGGRTASSRRAGLLLAVVTGGATAIACLAATGTAVLMGTASWPVIVAVLLITATIGVWRRVSRLPRRAPPLSGASAPVGGRPDTTRMVLETMSTPELCLAWRRSYRALVDADSAKEQDDIVLMRRAMLDQLECRDPEGFRRWLEGGARASSDPGRYLSPHVGDG